MKRIIIALIFILMASPANAALDAIVGNWTFDIDGAIFVNDSSGYNNNGTITAATHNSDSVNNQSLKFDGDNDYVHNTSAANFIPTGDQARSLTIWLKPELTTGFQLPFVIGSSTTNNGWGLGITPAGVIYLNGFGNDYVTTSSVRNNTWEYIGISYDSAILNIYKGDTLIHTVSTSDFNTNNSGFYFGISPDASSNDYKGFLDEIKLYNYSINATSNGLEYQRFQPVPGFPTGGMVISATYPPQTTQVNFSWHDTEYAGDRLQVALDSSFNVIVADVTTSNDYYLATLPSGDTYFWRVRQYDSVSNTYGDTSQTENFSITSASSSTGNGVQGVVYELIEGQIVPINEAQVYIYNNTFSNFMTTGSNGYYLFDGLANGTYNVYAVKQDYDTTAALPVNVSGALATQDILMKKFISPYIPNFVYEKFIVRGLFDDSYPGVTVNVYEGDSLTISQTGITDSMGQVVFRLFKDQKYRVNFSGGGIGSPIEVTVYAKEESYLVRIISGFPTGGDRNTDITSNLTSVTINATWSNLSLIYNDTRSSTSIVWFYAKNLSTNVTCYRSMASTNIVTLGCPVMASGKYQFGFNATSSIYGFFKQDKIINFDVGKPATPAITTNIDKTLLQWASIILIVLVASLFSVKSVKFGAPIVPLFALVLWAFGWFEPIPGNVIASLLLLSCAVCLGVMVYLRQSETKAVYQ